MALYDLTGGQLEKVPPLLNPMQALVAAAFVLYSSHMFRVAFAGLDNVNPRQKLKNLTGIAARAQAAHENGLETFPMFAAGVISAAGCGVDVDVCSRMATAYVITRAVFSFIYIFLNTNDAFGALRSLAFVAGQYISFRMMVLAGEAKYGGSHWVSGF
ncbi:hypothetical protein CYMTET_12052 [Cymbomonas tetramitiformis]|uniref:MAPEG family protein n=1 Tax=Cymbomonas tetramitiformis TaxID=36881 RepID=A0AAE0LCU9_9CHLO|nr:hypothetical protein CYMTET_12052 [Cymbomonas tetramitiformis]|eukprot:gene24062-29203_t